MNKHTFLTVFNNFFDFKNKRQIVFYKVLPFAKILNIGVSVTEGNMGLLALNNTYNHNAKF